MLRPYLKRAPTGTAMNVLRLGVVEICAEGSAAHGVVNSAVEILSKSPRTVGLKGLANAVLRKIAAEGAEGWNRLAVPKTANWLREPLVAGYGRDVMEAMEAAHFAGAPLDLTAKGDPEAVAAAVGGEVLANGSVRLRDAGQVSMLPGCEAGDWWVQDAAAASPVQILAPQPGEQVLDLCAAPGGKTMQMAAAGADVVAVDVSEGRMSRVEENLARTGLKAEVVVQDALAFDRGGFDAILLDAPCSATGTLRRHPDLQYAKDGSEFGALIGNQGAFIDHALSLLKPGGRLVFCTCSLLPDEGEVQVDELLVRHPEIEVDHHALSVAGVEPEWITQEGGLRLRPDFWADQGGMDGFYIACLRKPA
jgi:16S rRNA (cytosine967-C5)-methyltransferase